MSVSTVRIRADHDVATKNRAAELLTTPWISAQRWVWLAETSDRWELKDRTHNVCADVRITEATSNREAEAKYIRARKWSRPRETIPRGTMNLCGGIRWSSLVLPQTRVRLQQLKAWNNRQSLFGFDIEYGIRAVEDHSRIVYEMETWENVIMLKGLSGKFVLRH